MDDEGKFVIPGEVIYDAEEKKTYVPGKGCYQMQGLVRASTIGYVHIHPHKQGEKTIHYVDVQIGEKVVDTVMPEEGTIVTAIVKDVGQQWAGCHLLSIEDRKISKDFDYILPKKNMRSSLFLSDIEILDCVQPCDIILARIVDYSFQKRAYVLSIAEDELGVVYAKGRKSRLRPLDFETVIDDLTGIKEKRKIAKVPMHLNDELFAKLIQPGESTA
ncbi:unnamed protein product, partial [Mesorhabditis belari]